MISYEKNNYIYGATGVKLQKQVNDTGNIIKTKYAGNYIYENNNLKFFRHPEGYAQPNGTGGFDYVYSYLDYLGNVRLNYSDTNNDGTITTDEIIEENHYYPFGLEHKGYNNVVNGTEHQYKYNGKEHQEELGLNWLDYGARNYDASLGRYFSMDRLSEAYYDLNPYQYTANNPIKFIDVNGDYIYVGVNGYRYNNGELQEKKDDKWVTYNPEEGSYEAKILANLNKITEGDPNSFGSQFLGLFENDDINVKVKQNTSKGKYKGRNVTDPQDNTVYTFFNQKGSIRTTGGNEKLTENFHITLGHELAHGLGNSLIENSKLSETWIKADPDIGLKKPITKSEVFASMYENLLRGSQGLELRTHYIGGTSDDRSRLIKKSKTKNPFAKVYNPTEATLKIWNELVKNKKK
ncbi:RHS repeat-associated core domain-containing protein [Lutibacter sp.]|uniref:RHS repeat-associated core domain-containing protein n=1 Tax=Lutibacter sp. TaxID=1925666 RepID=UPI0025C5668A|nr:RHS repeat-associated core domain-containing protein [Lutibacter sp.]MCF6167977.1 RHS repeat-associated core domain-containing protein [Lutibacter sp.]